jgi:D-glycero-beta-D-manno-heptose-7-phosphate kinase
MMHGVTADALRALLGRFTDRRIAVLGDPMLDCYLYGTTHRISREAPVLIVREDGREHRLGGAANTAANLAALGANTQLLGLVGADADGDRLMLIARNKGIDTARLIRRHAGCTVTKTRVLAGGLHTTKQQMLRIDRENDTAPSEQDRDRLRAAARESLADLDGLVISDYGDGSLTSVYADIAREARARGRVVVVDSRRALSSYPSVSAVTPNEPEAEAALGVPLRSAEDSMRAAERLREQLDLDAAILTRGREGMAIAERNKPAVSIPAHGGHEAVDVTGAGDTVAAVFALALSAGGSVLEAATLANCAASIVVKSVGAATCTPLELSETLEGR